MMFGFRGVRCNSWRWRPLLEKWGHLRVLIDPSILYTATFLIVNDDPRSTVFFVRRSGESYAVTTRHSIVGHDYVSIRFNLKGGGTEDQAFFVGEWVLHSSTDIAILPLEFSLDRYFVSHVDLQDFASKYSLPVTLPRSPSDKRPEWYPLESHPRFGTGDEILTVGLFEGHTGEHLAQPLARFGHIALNPMEGEKVLAEINPPVSEGDLPDLTPIDAFLVEMAIWPGQSGSPVFLRILTQQWSETKYTYCLIGMVQGFYPREQDVKINNQAATIYPLHMGIGIVIPARDIMEMFMENETLVDQIKKLKERKKQSRKIRPSAASIRKEADITKQSFEDILKQVSRKTSEPES
jgi:hypothetical protein